MQRMHSSIRVWAKLMFIFSAFNSIKIFLLIKPDYNLFANLYGDGTKKTEFYVTCLEPYPIPSLIATLQERWRYEQNLTRTGRRKIFPALKKHLDRMADFYRWPPGRWLVVALADHAESHCEPAHLDIRTPKRAFPDHGADFPGFERCPLAHNGWDAWTVKIAHLSAIFMGMHTFSRYNK